uniref:AzlC family ABC transporter permease n=1 Tax=Falsiroseomonas oryzae TaxID=2766473 RepID=UPI0022EAB7A0
MGVTFLAFGAAVAEAGLPMGWALLCSAAVYGMAGQLVLLGLAAGPGGAVLPAVVAATAANARFLPMAVAIAPLLGPRGSGWRR